MTTRRLLVLAMTLAMAVAAVASMWHVHVGHGNESVRVPGAASTRGAQTCAACILSSHPAQARERDDLPAPVLRQMPSSAPSAQRLPRSEPRPSPSPRGPPASPSIGT